MKTLDELGISPAPWSEMIGCIIAGRREGEFGYEQLCELNNAADARLIASAPELYEALRGLCEWLADGIKERGSINPHWAKAMDALAKASGEGGVAK